jgi:hypothetical protein
VCLSAGLTDERTVGVFGDGVKGSVEFAVEFLGACFGAGVQPQPARGQDQGVAGGQRWRRLVIFAQAQGHGEVVDVVGGFEDAGGVVHRPQPDDGQVTVGLLQAPDVGQGGADVDLALFV